MIKEDLYRIGKLGKPHGVKGEINFLFDDDVFERVDADYLILQLDGIMVPFYLEEYRFKSDEVALVKFESIDTQERAAELTNTEVFFPRSLAEEEEHDFTYAELVGYKLVDANTGSNVGVIASVDDSTDNILFELENGALIPAPEELIEEVDQDARTITMSLPEGLLEL